MARDIAISSERISAAQMAGLTPFAVRGIVAAVLLLWASLGFSTPAFAQAAIHNGTANGTVAATVNNGVRIKVDADSSSFLGRGQ